ncbi:MAG: hypothetical protein K2H38_13325, partial [Muribaculaceae bacterium]|nr:hypothetical protein [Muribaculaceae bacterium]
YGLVGSETCLRDRFFDMKADGFSLDDKRNPVADNDIPDVIARFRNPEGEEDRKRTDKSFFVPVEEIREHSYDLSFNTYKETVREAVVYDAPEVILDRLHSLEESFLKGMSELCKMIVSHEA